MLGENQGYGTINIFREFKTINEDKDLGNLALGGKRIIKNNNPFPFFH